MGIPMYDENGKCVGLAEIEYKAYQITLESYTDKKVTVKLLQEQQKLSLVQALDFVNNLPKAIEEIFWEWEYMNVVKPFEDIGCIVSLKEKINY